MEITNDILGGAMTVNIPAFLQPLVRHIRSKVGEQINVDEKEDKDSGDE